MGKGKVWPAEWRSFTDSETGAKVTQLTNYKGHSHHLYFTNLGWYDNGRKLLIGSDRNGSTNLFTLDLDTGEIVQLTDLEQTRIPRELSFLTTTINPRRPEAYFWHGRRLMAIRLDTLQERVIYEIPEGFMTSMINCTADGRYVCGSIYEDLSDQFEVDLLHGYVGFREYWAAKPLSQVIKVDVDGSGGKVVHEENSWIGHVNTSPTQAAILTFCHEGPWDKVDNRIWGLNIETGEVWKIRPTEKGETVGHEYWLADGIRIGYHGRTSRGPVFGIIRYDNTELDEAYFPRGSTHFHSNDEKLIVGDGSRSDPYVYLWKRQGSEYTGPRKLCLHRSSFHIQQCHVHPRFSPDGRQVLFTSDRIGYGNVYLVDVPDFDFLPEVEET